MTPFQTLPVSQLPSLPDRPHRYFELDEHTVQVASGGLGTVSTHLRSAGSGPPLVLVHGLMTAGYSFRYIVDVLAEHFTVWIPDLPGAGRSGPSLSGPYSPENMSAWLVGLFDALDLRGAAVVGRALSVGAVSTLLEARKTGV